MAEAKREITIDRPREEVFSFLANSENDTAWRLGILDIAHSSASGQGAREAELKGLQKLMAPMVTRSMGNQVGALAKLKQALEAAA